MDPTDIQLYATSKAAMGVNDKDDFCVYYITAFHKGKLE